MASASAVASKGVPLAALLKELLASPSASGKTTASARRLSISKLFSADSSDEDAVAAARRRERDLSIAKLFSGGAASRWPFPSPPYFLELARLVKRKKERVLMIWWFSADVLDEASKMRLLLALTEDDVGAASRTGGFSPRGWWVSKEVGDAVQLKVAMPGLGKEHVKMRAEKNVLVIKGEGDKGDSEGDDDKVPARYIYRIGLPSQAFKMDQIKAEMKNGVLMVTVPKIKDEERKDVFEIKIE